MKKITRLITGVGLIASSLWAHPDGAEASVPNQVEEIIEWAVPAGVSRASVDRVISEAERARVIEARYIFGSGGHELTIGVPWNGTLNDDSQVIAATFSDLEGSPNAMAGDGPPEGGERSGEAVENPLPALLSAGREEVGSRGAQPAILVIEGAKVTLST